METIFVEMDKTHILCIFKFLKPQGTSCGGMQLILNMVRIATFGEKTIKTLYMIWKGGSSQLTDMLQTSNSIICRIELELKRFIFHKNMFP